MLCGDILICACGSFVPQQRSIYAVFTLISVVLMSMQRHALSTSIGKIAPSANTTLELKLLCKNNTLTKDSTVIEEIVTDWSMEDITFIKLSFHFPYFLLVIPLGCACDRYGSRTFLIVSLFSSSIITGFTPAVIQLSPSWHWIAVWQAVLGSVHSIIVPGMTTLLAKWIPAHERGLYASVSFSAEICGYLLGIQSSLALQRSTHKWSYIFYILGIVGVFWSGICGLYIYSSPNQHPRLPEKEKKYLEEQIGRSQYSSFPVLKIMTDLSVIGQSVARFGNEYFLAVYSTKVPVYSMQVLHYNHNEFNFIQCAGFMACTVLCGKISDVIGTENKFAYMRSVFTQIGTFVPCGLLMIASHMHCEISMVKFYLAGVLITKGAYYVGAGINVLDTTLVHSGGVKGIIMLFGALGEVLGPVCWDYSLGDMTNWDSYHINFSLICFVCVSSSIFFATFVRAERAAWDYHPEEEAPEKSDRNFCMRSLACYNPH